MYNCQNLHNARINFMRCYALLIVEDFKMRLIDLKKVWDSDVEKWLIESIPELTAYQKEKIRDSEMVRFAPFYFMERNKKVKNVLLRFSIIAMPPVLLLLIIGLPFNFFVTGRWGYSDKMRWYGKWVSACGL